MQKYLPYLLMLILGISSCSPEETPPIEGKVIILMYHRISEGQAANLYERSVADFEKDLKYLHDNNIKVISFDELGEMVESSAVPATNCAVITFDDGDHSWLTRAAPLLKEYKMSATFFLWASMIEEERDSFVSWDEIEYMSRYIDQEGNRPFTFGSHTLYHQYLYTKKLAYNDSSAFAVYLDEELDGSKRLIDAHTPVEVTALSLPYGDGAGDEDIIANAVSHGYRYIRTSEWGALDVRTVDLLRLPSLPILAETDPAIIGTYLSE